MHYLYYTTTKLLGGGGVEPPQRYPSPPFCGDIPDTTAQFTPGILF